MATFTAETAEQYLASITGIDGNVFCVWGEYDVTTSMTSGDVIKLAKVPGGCTVLPWYFADGGSGGAYDIGTTSSATLQANNQSSSGWVADGVGSEVGSEGEDVDICLTVATAPTSAATVKLFVFYTLTNIKD